MINICWVAILVDVVLLAEPFIKEFLHRVCVPLVDGEALHYVAVIIQELNDWIGTANIAHSQSWELSGPVALDKGLDLWISPQFSLTHYKFCIGVKDFV